MVFDEVVDGGVEVDRIQPYLKKKFDMWERKSKKLPPEEIEKLRQEFAADHAHECPKCGHKFVD